MIKLSDVATSTSNDNHFPLNLKVDDGKRSEPNLNKPITSALLNKSIGSIKNFCNIYIESKHTKIIKHKKMTSIIQNLKEIHADLWGLPDLPFISKKSMLVYY